MEEKYFHCKVVKFTIEDGDKDIDQLGKDPSDRFYPTATAFELWKPNAV
jgi:hypothetical protein